MIARQGPKICIFGVFGDLNVGNDSTLQAMLRYVYRRFPSATVTCVCMDPSAVKRIFAIDAVSMNGSIQLRPESFRSNVLGRTFRKLFIGVPAELRRWHEAFKALKGVKFFIVPGTGLLHDAHGLRNWGPYTLFKWSLLARLRGGKVLFVSVGAGPIYSRMGKWLLKATLGLASFRSYRDQASKEYLTSIGLPVAHDPVYPDLAFSLQHPEKQRNGRVNNGREIIGLGLMLDAGRYSRRDSETADFQVYLESLASLGEWALARGYDIRLLVGDRCDLPVREEWKSLIARRAENGRENRIMDDPKFTSEEFFSQVEELKFVVATRFHNVLLSLLCNKPVISLSFHHKCSSLMESMGMSEYCLDMNKLDSSELLNKASSIERNAEELKRIIRSRVDVCRAKLEEQFERMFSFV
jgi:polysaccharide pyruvyl transferase WcaK-like protein